MPNANALDRTPRRKTLYFDGETARILEIRAEEEHRSESNYLQHLIILDNRAKRGAAFFLDFSWRDLLLLLPVGTTAPGSDRV
jgi:hypothetical protein